MILPESRLTTLRFARTYFARAPATKTRGGLSARQMSGKSQSCALRAASADHQGSFFKADGCDPLLLFPEKLPSLLY